MKYELEALDAIISVSLKPSYFNKQKNKGAYLNKWSSLISAEVERLKNVLVQEILNCENENRIGCYVMQHQHGIIKLLDVLHFFSAKEGIDNVYKYPALKTFANAYRKLLEILVQILILLRNDFKLYFDFAFKIPEYERLSIVPGIKETAKEITNRLKNCNIENDLIDIVIIPFKYFLNDENETNQEDLKYLRPFKKAIKSFLTKKDIDTSSVYELLIQMNQNEPAFAFYYIQALKDATSVSNQYPKSTELNDHWWTSPQPLSEGEGLRNAITSTIEFYYLQFKIINQISREPGIAFDPSLPSAHDQLATWLSEEIYYLEKKQQIEYSFPITDNNVNTKIEKVQTVLSVSQLSLAVKLLLDSGIIKTRHTRDVMRMVSKNFKTANVAEISEDSLRNKVYNIEPAAVEGMKKVIMGLWDKVREY